MRLKKLKPGDICFLEKPQPTEANPNRVIRYRHIVAEALTFPRKRGEKETVPVFRPINRKKTQCNLDRPDNRVGPPRIRWIEREKLSTGASLNNPSSPTGSP